MTLPTFTDTHCHLDFEKMGSIEQVIKESVLVGVTRFIVPSVNHNNWNDVLALSQDYASISCGLGVHPYFISDNNHIGELETLAKYHRDHIVAIGEIGLDGSIDCPMSMQLEVLKPQLALACSLELPVICHAHKAYDVLLKQLRLFKLPRGGVIHGFSGSLVQAKEFLKLGFYLGVGGIITYDRAKKTRGVLSQLPLESLLLETDSPDMPLSGKQGEINHPKNIPLIAKQLGELLQLPLEHIVKTTHQNTQQLFKI